MGARAKTGTTYQSAGVDSAAADAGLARIAARVRKTWPAAGEPDAVVLDLGHFANVIDLGGGAGLALCTDGVGSKALIAQMVGRYDTIGIDCVAMNVNDLVCIGARPISFLDYIAVERADPGLLDEIAKGLCAGAGEAGVSISGGEIAQLGDMIKGHTGGQGFDLVGMAAGTVALDAILTGAGIEDGDAVIGLESNGVHSNGLSLARKTFFTNHAMAAGDTLPGIAGTLGEELLRPTFIYVREALAVRERVPSLKAMVHITGDGFLNLARVQSEVGFVLNALPAVPPIFSRIAEYGEIAAEEMYAAYNMGIGFCFVAAADAAGQIIEIAADHGRKAAVIGVADSANAGRITIPANAFADHDIIGEGKTFRRA